jgi:hypothetical protein
MRLENRFIDSVPLPVKKAIEGAQSDVVSSIVEQLAQLKCGKSTCHRRR